MNDAKRFLEIVLSEEITDRIKVVGNIDKADNNITAADVSLLFRWCSNQRTPRPRMNNFRLKGFL